MRDKTLLKIIAYITAVLIILCDQSYIPVLAEEIPSEDIPVEAGADTAEEEIAGGETDTDDVSIANNLDGNESSAETLSQNNSMGKSADEDETESSAAAISPERDGETITAEGAVVAVNAVTVDTSATVNEGQQTTITAWVWPKEATNKAVEWSITDDSIAAVATTSVDDSTGKIVATVTGKKTGTSTITVTSKYNSSKKATCKLTVTVPVNSVSLSPSTLTMDCGSTYTLTANVLPSDAYNKNVTWSSDKIDIVKVDSNGKLTALKEGSATITVTTKDGSKTATCVVKVKNVKVEKITLNQTAWNLEPRKSYGLTATISPSNATDNTLTWSSDKPEIATVNDKGIVTAVAASDDKATVTATANDGSGVSASCTIRVASKVHNVVFNARNGTVDKYVPVIDGQTVSKPADPTYYGYTFVDWYGDADLSTTWDFSTAITNQQILYAKWEKKEFNVTFHLDGGTSDIINDGHTFKVQEGKSFENPATTSPKKSGYIFSGWYCYTPEKKSWNFSTDTVTGDLELHAEWTEIPQKEMSVSIAWDDKDDEAGERPDSCRAVLKIDNVVKETIALSDDGSGNWKYTWPTEYPLQKEDGSYISYGVELVEADYGLYSISKVTKSDLSWTYTLGLDVCTVTFNTDGGTSIAQTGVRRGEPVAKPSTPTRTGYTFVNWFLEGSNIAYDFSDNVYDDITLEAEWTTDLSTRPLKVHYIGNDGTTAQKEQTITGNGKLDANTFVRKGYKLKEWNTQRAEGGLSFEDEATIVNSDFRNQLDLYAIWRTADPTEDDPVPPENNVLTLNDTNALLALKGKYTIDAPSGSKIYSSNDKIVKVTKNMKVKPRKAGTAEITVVYGSEYAKLQITVEKPLLKRASTSAGAKDIRQLGMLLNVKYLVPERLESNKPSVASVSSDNLTISANSPGKAKITAYFGNKKYKATLQVR